MTDEQILEVARRKGYFEVSWRWRDDRLRTQCKRLVKKRLLKRAPYKPGSDTFLPVVEPDIAKTGVA